MNKYIRSALSWLYLRLGNKISFKKNNENQLITHSLKYDKSNSPRIAFICDEMTWCDYSEYACSLFIHPEVWKIQFEAFKPEILFCESAWCGIDKYQNCWRGRVYRDKRLVFDNRKEITDIVKYCKENGIKTVFWNKEDPTFFSDDVYDFVSTALMFDYVFTTAEECIEKYKSLGHTNVLLMSFGVNLDMFFHSSREFKKNTVIFAGSWFGNQKQRCLELSNLLDYVIESGMELDIYDRKSESKDKKFRFPKKYQKYIKPSVKYENIAALLADYEYAVNVNTVKNSKTMFSRRVLQLAAAGNIVISNSFDGLQSISDCVDIIDKPKENIVMFQGVDDKMIVHNCKSQLEELISIVLHNKEESVIV